MPDRAFTKEVLDQYLKELAKEYRRINGKSMPAEIILIGGASAIMNYGFREMTYDTDALIHAASSMKEAINTVGDRNGLPNGWMNDDFRKTRSYTDKIIQYSKYYRTFYGVLEVRSVVGEYLVAMKLRSGRKYKFDRSDVIGILWEHKRNGTSLTLEKIKNAIEVLYGSYDVIDEDVKQFIERAVQDGNYESMYKRIRQAESENREILLEYQEEKPDTITEDNVNDIISALKKRRK